MTTDYRALCAELLAHAQTAQAVAVGEGLWDGSEDDGLFDRARTALALPVAEGPTDEELEDLADAMNTGGYPMPAMRRALELWGRPTITPIPVSERLPGAEDCDAEGRCWFGMWGEFDGEMIPDWELTRLEDYTNEGRLRIAGWLPAHALPLPGQPAPTAPAP